MRTIPSLTQNHAPLPTALLLLAPILAIVVYFSALNGALIHDGARLTAMNPQVTGSTGWVQLWTRPTPEPPLGGEVYRPVMGSLLRIQWTLWGSSPSSFHSVNLLLWAGVILLYLLFISRLVTNPLARAIAVLLMALHPMASQSVYGVAGQGALLCLLACLMALWLVQVSRQGRLGQGMLLAGVSVCSLTAFGSHEMGLLLPVWLLAQWLLIPPSIDSIQPDITMATPGREGKKPRKKSSSPLPELPPAPLNPIWVAAPVLVSLAIYLSLRYMAMDGLMPASPLLDKGWPESLGGRLPGGFSVFALALTRLLWPAAPTLFYDPGYGLDLPAPWIGILLFAAALALTLLAIRRSKVAALALIMTLSPLLALSQWLPLTRFFSEAPLLFALPGLALLAACLIARIAPGETMPPASWRGRLAGVAALIALAAMAWQTYSRGKDWKTAEIFWTNEAQRHPGNPQPLIRLMEEVIRLNQAARLSSLTSQAMTLAHPREIDRIRQLQASFYGMQPDKKPLSGLLDEILASDRIYPVGYARSLAAVAQASSLTQREEALWRRELTVNPEDFDAHYRLAEIAFDKGAIAEAIGSSEKAVQHAPRRFKARAMALYGKMLIEGGHLREGAQQLQVALRNDPTMYEPYIYLIRLKWGVKDYEGAERLITQCNLNANVSSLVDLAILYSSMLDEQGKTGQTLELMRRWVELYPGDVQLHLFVARYLVDHRIYEPAKKIYQRLLPSLSGAQLSEVWTGLARVAKLGEGNTSIAIECLREALKANPGNDEARSLLGRFQAGSDNGGQTPALPDRSADDGAIGLKTRPPGEPVTPLPSPADGQASSGTDGNQDFLLPPVSPESP